MDKYYGNVCELDIIFNFQKAYFILDELLLAGELQESSKKNVLRCISQEDSLEDIEVSCFTCVYIFLSCTCAPPLDFSRPDVSGWRFHAIGLAHHLRTFSSLPFPWGSPTNRNATPLQVEEEVTKLM